MLPPTTPLEWNHAGDDLLVFPATSCHVTARLSPTSAGSEWATCELGQPQHKSGARETCIRSRVPFARFTITELSMTKVQMRCVSRLQSISLTSCDHMIPNKT